MNKKESRKINLLFLFLFSNRRENASEKSIYLCMNEYRKLHRRYILSLESSISRRQKQLCSIRHFFSLLSLDTLQRSSKIFLLFFPFKAFDYSLPFVFIHVKV